MKLINWWKELRYWQKGGTIGVVIAILLSIFSIVCVALKWGSDETIYCLVVPNLFIAILTLDLLDWLANLLRSAIPVIIVSYIISALSYFLIGAFIGFIIGKVRRK